MGNFHYVPEYYLKGFANEKGNLYCFTKEKDPFVTTPHAVAKISNFYSTETENYLSNIIENPFNKIKEKIINNQDLTKSDKEIIADYVSTLYKRTLKTKKQYEENAGEVIRDVTENTINKIKKKEISFNLPEETAINKLNKIMSDLTENPPNNIWEELIKPESTPSINEALRNMNWTFLIAKMPFFFITNDQPIFFFHEIGLGRVPYANLSFPISSNICLFLHWSNQIQTGYKKIDSSWISQLNLRTAVNSLKYVYSPRNEPWIQKFLVETRKLKPLISQNTIPIPGFFKTHRFHKKIMKKFDEEIL